MRNLIILSVLVFLIVSCGERQNKTNSTENVVLAITVDDLMASAVNFVDQEIVVSGLVTHVCKHGGQRCFVMGSTDDVVIRVEAGDEIASFKQEHVGDKLQITGILRLVPVDGGHVCSEEEEDDHEHDHGTSGVEGQVVVSETDENYVPRYYIDGLRFIVLSDNNQVAEEV
jgi:hypothetical protein